MTVKRRNIVVQTRQGYYQRIAVEQSASRGDQLSGAAVSYRLAAFALRCT